MGTKDNPGRYDCHGKAAADEPLFTLLARDPLAPHLVRLWSFLARGHEAMVRGEVEDALHTASNGGRQPPEKIFEAFHCGEEMKAWRAAHPDGPPLKPAEEGAAPATGETAPGTPWITHLQDDEPDGWDLDGTGMPGASLFARALSVWLHAQNRTGITVGEAALAFNVTPEIIRHAVDEHAWLLLGPDDVIESEGE